MNDSKVALIVFIACDIFIESKTNFRMIVDYYCDSVRVKTKDVFKK